MLSGVVRKPALDGVPEKAGGRGGDVLLNVQCLRALSAILVIVAHVDGLLAAAGSFRRQAMVSPVFGGAVAVFFVISGFIMVYTTRGRRMTPREFMAHRLIRIVPLYWAITIFLFCLVLTLPGLVQATRADPVELLKSLTFIPFVKSNGLAEPLLFVGWTLNYEMAFYLLFAAGLWFRNRFIGTVSVIIVLLGVVAFGAIVQPTDVIARFYTSSLALEFVAGMIIALVLPRLPPRASPAQLTTAIGAVLVGITGAATLPFLLPQAAAALVCGMPTALFIAGVIALDRWGWKVRNSFLLLLGETSYSLYLTHSFVTQSIEKFGERIGATGVVAAALVMVAISACCIVGVVVYRLVEKPLWQMARRAFLAPSIKTQVATS